MNDMIFIFGGAAIFLLLIILLQQCIYIKEMQKKLIKVSKKLEHILESGSDERVMEFTSNKALIELMSRINELLIDRQKIKVDFKRTEISSKKMLANISHDIKTPLTVILGYLEIMRLNHAEDEMLRKTEEKAKQVMEMLSQFFSLAKLEAGDTPVCICRIDIAEICRENILSFYDILFKNNFEVEISVPDKPVYAQCDRGAVGRILSNLITNVVRYGNEGKYVGINVRQDDSLVYIDVKDKGRGIEKEFASAIFERLYTLEDSRSRDIQGNGLGLTIAKNLAARMDGDITLYSEPGVETIFTVQLKK